jgi:hypothetical protein
MYLVSLQVFLAQNVGRANAAKTQSSLKLQELGPRMSLELVKLEEGVCTGQVGVCALSFGGNTNASA